MRRLLLSDSDTVNVITTSYYSFRRWWYTTEYTDDARSYVGVFSGASKLGGIGRDDLFPFQNGCSDGEGVHVEGNVLTQIQAQEGLVSKRPLLTFGCTINLENYKK